MKSAAERALILAGVHIRLQNRPLFAPLNLTVNPGEVVTVMGPSGCGKSTLLSYVCGTLAPAFQAEGSVRLGKRELVGLPLERRRIGILFQDALLFPHLSVAENLAFGLPPGLTRRERRLQAARALLDAGLEGLDGCHPATLSGGQRARAALMRTLLAEPEALLLDEPFAKLDADLRARIRTFVFEHARQRGLPTLLVTHDPADAQAAGGSVITLSTDPWISAGNPAPSAANPGNRETAPRPVPTAPHHP